MQNTRLGGARLESQQPHGVARAERVEDRVKAAEEGVRLPQLGHLGKGHAGAAEAEAGVAAGAGLVGAGRGGAGGGVGVGRLWAGMGSMFWTAAAAAEWW